jgi:hypothetical protein
MWSPPAKLVIGKAGKAEPAGYGTASSDVGGGGPGSSGTASSRLTMRDELD